MRLISVPLTDGQFDVLLSFTFNLGAEVLQCLTLRRKVHQDEPEGVPAELIKGAWATRKRLPGLACRRKDKVLTYASLPTADAAMHTDDGHGMHKG
jgi:lysozyme